MRKLLLLFLVLFTACNSNTRDSSEQPLQEEKPNEMATVYYFIRHEMYDASKLNDEDFQKKTKGKTVLVVGHSNTNPQFVNYILEEEKYEDIPDEESGSLFIVSVSPDGKKHSQVLYIN